MHLPEAGKPFIGNSRLGAPALLFGAGGDLDRISEVQGGEREDGRDRGSEEDL